MKALAPLALALLAGCSADRPTELYVWAHDAELEVAARAAAERIETATGLTVHVNAPDTVTTAVSIFWSEALPDPDWTGLFCGEGDWIAISTKASPGTGVETMVLHETMHAFGAPHVNQGAGMLSPDTTGQGVLTAADLEALCAVAACSRLEPE